MTAPGETTFRNFLSEEDGALWYQYVGNNPVNAVDPLGLSIKTFFDKIGYYIKNMQSNDIYRSLSDEEREYATFFLGNKMPNNTNEIMLGAAYDDPTTANTRPRSISLPNDVIRLTSLALNQSPMSNIRNRRVLIHELVHQYQYETTFLGALRFMFEGIFITNPYDYDTHNSGEINSLSDIHYLEGQAKFIEDFVDAYEGYKTIQNNIRQAIDNKDGGYPEETLLSFERILEEKLEQVTQFAEVLRNSGFQSASIEEVLGCKN